jgi:transcriptional regulator with XRE-family HTH domain
MRSSQQDVTRQTPGPEASVGAEIRELRKARGFTLKTLSERTGRSIAYLSRIERGDSRISVDLLHDIGTALNVDPRWFFPERSGKGPLERACVVRARARRPLSQLYTRSFAELGFQDELLSGSLAGGYYMILSRFPPGPSQLEHPEEGYVFEGEQHGLVIKGRIEMTLGDEVIVLEAGDSFSYDSMLPHRFRNPGSSEAEVVWSMAPVRINW